MKKTYLFTALLAGLVAAGCSQNETIGDMVDGAQTPVAFGTYVGKTTNGRAVEKTAFEAGNTFGVFGYYTQDSDYTGSTAPNFMFNEVITATGASTLTWGYSPIKYWPNKVTSDSKEGKVSFFAYSPMPANDNGVTLGSFVNTLTTDPKILYTASDLTKQVDLLWGVQSANGLPFLDQTKPASITDKISFVFKHALACVGFKIQLADDITNGTDTETSVTIDKIEFGGTLATSIEDALVGALTPSATLNLNNTTDGIAKWEVPATTGLYCATLVTADFGNNGIFGGNGNALLTGTITNNNDKNLMIIPQDFSLTGAKMRITYTVKTEDSKLATSSSVTNKHVADVNVNFENGKKYIYTLNIGLTSVKVEGSVFSWADANPQPSDITVN